MRITEYRVILILGKRIGTAIIGYKLAGPDLQEISSNAENLVVANGLNITGEPYTSFSIMPQTELRKVAFLMDYLQASKVLRSR